MIQKTLRRVVCGTGLACALALGAVSEAAAQTTPGDRDLAAIASWVAVDAATGYERRIAPALAAALGWEADAHGNVVTTIGSGSPHRIVACALDRPSYGVTQIRDDGYLRLHRIGNGSRHPLWDQQFEAQQVRVMTTKGPVAGVVARANGHFASQHRHETRVISADDLWVDVGAESRADVDALGIALLDPVSRELPPWPMAGAIAGPDAGRRAGCAAVVSLAAAARRGDVEGRVTFVLSAQEVMGWIGLSSLVARGDRPGQVIVLAPGASARAESDRPVDQLGAFGDVLADAGVATVRWIAPAVEQAGSHMEVIGATEAAWLRDTAASAARIAPATAWVAAPPPQRLRSERADPAFESLVKNLTGLAERPGVSGHEWPVRRAVLEAMPSWARERAVVDAIGNVWVEAGPAGPATVFMAHMDEVGYTVASVAPDGTVALDAQGGVLHSAWEGQTALLHFEPPRNPTQTTAVPEPLRGVFRIRETAGTRHPSQLQAWFGLSGDALAARGVVAGMQVTSFKQGIRLGRTRYTSRALDDRAGTTALLRALQQIDPARLASRVIFAWSVEEETGLIGAAAMAKRFGGETARIYSIDTFVSSDTPLESPHFAHTPLGRGPVLRAIESSGVSPDAERARVRRIAETAGIPLQVGLTQGGTDGTAFTFRGAPNQGLSWPGRYSHSPGEVLDLRDLDALARLIARVATRLD